MSKIDNWSFVNILEDEYKAPEQATVVIIGTVYGDSRAVDGTPIRTSILEKFDIKNNRAFTRNTLYDLGSIDPAFEKYMVDNGHTISQYAESYPVI